MTRPFCSRFRRVGAADVPRSRVALAGIALLVAITPLTVAAQRHTIAPGETLSGIAALYGVDLHSLATENGIDDANFIVAGRSLTVPGPGGSAPSDSSPPAEARYVVAEGDTLATIAGRLGVGVLQLAANNRLADPDLIYPGQVLTIGAAPTSALPSPGPLPSEAMRAILADVEVEFDIPSGLLLALAWQESGWQQHVTSNAGAVGLTQLLPITALWALEYLVDFDAEWETSARDNARVGASVMRHYLRLTAGDARWSLAAYYQGWQSVQDVGMFEETEIYVANVVALWDEFR